MRGFVDRHELDGLFPHLNDADGELWSRFGVGGHPAWAFVDRGGEFELVFGPLSDEQLQERLDALAAS
ncbi:MAG: hypothetical protein ACRDUY_04450 [Nitriliruptorales bacterium]